MPLLHGVNIVKAAIDGWLKLELSHTQLQTCALNLCYYKIRQKQSYSTSLTECNDMWWGLKVGFTIHLVMQKQSDDLVKN